jgi:haloacetate dehalogenase
MRIGGLGSARFMLPKRVRPAPALPEDRRRRRRITCPVLALWSARGPLSSWYSDLGGPLGIWRDLAYHVAGGPVEGGHFFPEEHPDQTATALAGFFSGVESIH